MLEKTIGVFIFSILISVSACSQDMPSLRDETAVTRESEPEKKCISCSQIASRWKQSGFPEATVFSLNDFETSPYRYVLKLQVINIIGSGWSNPELQARYLKVKEVFKQCSLKIEGYIVNISAPLNDQPIDPGDIDRSSSQSFGERIPQFENTIYMIHLKKLVDGVAAVSGPILKYGEGHKLVHKNWISIKGKEGAKDPLWVTEAHELGHDLFNMNHTDYKNLMGGWPWLLSSEVLQDQCESLERHPQVVVVDK